ncbi:MAG: ABC transporter permease [bacterium]|nr:ABC transporter permease [bacterium]
MDKLASYFKRPAGRIQSYKIGFFLALRDIKKANKWTTLLIIAVMVLTFLNMIVLNGILVGLIEGSITAHKERMAGDVVISTLTDKTDITKSQEIINFIESLKEVKAYTPRYTESGKLTANYERRTKETDHVDKSGGTVYGIDLEKENEVTGISKYLAEGEFIGPDDHDKVVLGANLLSKYLDIESPELQVLRNVETGSKIKITVAGITKEVTVKGVIKSKVDFDQGIIMLDSDLKKIANRSNNNVNSIILRLNDGVSPEYIKSLLLNQGYAEYARIQTFEEALPKFLLDLKMTFSLLGNLIGTIGIAVAAITIFIIIFVNAITRRKYIGIMKGIGVRKEAIELSYIFQSLFYAVVGIILGSLIVFLLLQPYFFSHPINFPFSDGILVATPVGTIIRAIILLVATLIAGYIPARIVVKQNTLDAILGR